MQKPPLDIEQAIDLILAVPSMFSRNSEGQKDFGKVIVEEYFVKLRTENKDDPVAYKYIVNLFALISSTIRAFAVQRDVFETSWRTIEEIKKHELEAAKRLTDYSPFRGGGFWEKLQGLVISLFGGGGIGAALGVLLKTESYEKLFIVALTLVGWVFGIIGFDYWLHKRKDRRVNEILKKYPTDVNHKWKSEIMPQYKKIIKGFLISAIKIREEFYPDLPTLKNSKIFQSNFAPHIQFGNIEEKGVDLDKGDIEDLINNIVERHFAF